MWENLGRVGERKNMTKIYCTEKIVKKEKEKTQKAYSEVPN